MVYGLRVLHWCVCVCLYASTYDLKAAWCYSAAVVSEHFWHSRTRTHVIVLLPQFYTTVLIHDYEY